MKRTSQARWAGALLAIGLLTAACSSSSSSPGVVSPPSSGTVGNTGSAASGQSGSSGQSAMDKGIAYAQCMRAHGEPKFPDPAPGPNGQGLGWSFGPNTGIDPNSSQYQAATKDCGQPPSLNGAPPPPLTAAQQQQYLKWAACIRAHGVPSFKDPTFVNGHPQITTSSGTGAQMKAAQQACASYLRGIQGSGGITTG